MYDAIFLVTIVAFFALCVAYIKGCDRIIGPDAEFETELEDESTIAGGVVTPVERGGMSVLAVTSAADNFVALGITAVVLVYLVLVLVFPERF